MIKVLFVCHGNICRSTMAEAMFKDMVRKAGAEDRYEIDSAAATREEIGNGMHYGARQKLNEVGIPIGNHRARLFTRQDYLHYDIILGMDSENMYDLNRMSGGDPDHKIYKLLELAGKKRDIADPWYTGNFDATYNDLVEGLSALFQKLEGDEV